MCQYVSQTPFQVSVGNTPLRQSSVDCSSEIPGTAKLLTSFLFPGVLVSRARLILHNSFHRIIPFRIMSAGVSKKKNFRKASTNQKSLPVGTRLAKVKGVNIAKDTGGLYNRGLNMRTSSSSLPVSG